jgi:hypothetical protein
MKKCIIDGCEGKSRKRGWCSKHYTRWRKHGDPNVLLRVMSPRGSIAAFIEELVGSRPGNECVTWPFSVDAKGYARMSSGGASTPAHRIICERVNGPPPKSKRVVAHSCGNGHLGCVSPAHLRWATDADNALDMIKHGRSTRGEKSYNCKLDEAAVLKIFRRAQSGECMQDIADEVRTSRTTISKIKHGHMWGWLTGAGASRHA